MRSTASNRRAHAVLLAVIGLVPVGELATAPAQDPSAPATPTQEVIVLEQSTTLFEGPSPVFKSLGELKAKSRALLLTKQRVWARMKEVDGLLEGYGLLPTAKRVTETPARERLEITIKPSPTVVGLVTKGLAERLQSGGARDFAAVERMQQPRFTAEQLLRFMAELGI